MQQRRDALTRMTQTVDTEVEQHECEQMDRRQRADRKEQHRQVRKGHIVIQQQTADEERQADEHATSVDLEIELAEAQARSFACIPRQQYAGQQQMWNRRAERDAE